MIDNSTIVNLKNMLNMSKIRENRKILFAVFASIIVVATLGTYVVFYQHGTVHNGVPINFSLKFTGSIPSATPFVSGSGNSTQNFTNVYVSILSVVPSGINQTTKGNVVNISDMNQSSNSYLETLYSGRIQKLESQIYLGNNFFRIGNAWRSDNLSAKSYVSLQEDASYSFQHDGYIYVYNYFNNIMYSPFSSVFNSKSSFITCSVDPQLSLSSNIIFNLSHPSHMYKINMTSLQNGIGGRILNKMSASYTGRIFGGGGSTGVAPFNFPPCGLCGPECNGQYLPFNKMIKEKSWTGILPLTLAQLKNATDTNSEFTYGFLSITTGTNYQFNTAQACEYYSHCVSVQDSTVASFNKGYAEPLYGQTASLNELNGLNLSMIYLTNVSFTVEYYQVDYPTPIFFNNEWYCTLTYGPTVTSIKVDNTGNNTIDPTNILQSSLSLLASNSANSSQTGNMWAAFLNSIGFAKVSKLNLNPNAIYSNLNYSSNIKEYNNAAAMMKQMNNAVGTFTAMLGLALAVNEAVSIIPGAGTADDVVNGVSVADASIGLTSTLISDMSSISLEFMSHSNMYRFTLSNSVDGFYSGLGAGNTLSISIYSSQSTSFFIDSNGNSYNFYTPSCYFCVEPV